MNKEPVRIQRSRKHKQVSPNGLPIVYVGRPSEFGNPFHKGLYIKFTNADAVNAFEQWLTIHPDKARRWAKELAGKNLSCWCKPGDPCHADILLKLANQKP